MSALAIALAEIQQRNAVEPSLVEAAKAVVALTSWDQERQLTRTSAMAIDVLRKAIEREENPEFRLAPVELPRGL